MRESFKRRIGVDLARRIKLEDGIVWAGENDVHYLDIQIDRPPNALETFDEERCEKVKALCREHDVQLGLHTLSAMNVAEISPFLREAADLYLRCYIDAAVQLNAGWIEVHAGYHFTADYEERKLAGLERLRRTCAYAEERGVTLYLENMNREPQHAEVNYLGHTLDETVFYFNKLDSECLKWAFTVNHAHLVPEGIDGFINVMGCERLGVVRLADNLGDREHHMYPGTGNIDFANLFGRLETMGFEGHYMSGYGTLEDMVTGREILVQEAAKGGVPVA